jgi:hypothetical protein
MNTLNEFELNKIKKFYAQELYNRRLKRSKSTRLRSGAPSSSAAAVAQKLSELEQDGSQLIRRNYLVAAAGPATVQDTQVVVDLKRYQHALGRKSKSRFGSSSSPVARRSGATSSPRFARALYDFSAKNDGELSMKRGDLVEVLELLDGHDWARVEDCQSGLQGLVPFNYLDNKIGCAVAKRDVVSSRPNSRLIAGGAESHLHIKTGTAPKELAEQLLPMSRGEPIVLIRRLSGHLYEASNTRQAVGLVWSTDVEIIKQPPATSADHVAMTSKTAGLGWPSGSGLRQQQQQPQQQPQHDSYWTSGSNYEAPICTTHPNELGGHAEDNHDGDDDFTDDEFDDDTDDEDDEDGEDGEDDERELARCLRSICDLDRPGREAPTLDAARRRRARSASGALNEAYASTGRQRQAGDRQHYHQHHHHHQLQQQQHQQQQYCTMSKRQQQMVTQETCCLAHDRRIGGGPPSSAKPDEQRQPCCSCWTGYTDHRHRQHPAGIEHGTVARRPPRSSSSPQIGPPACEQVAGRREHEDCCTRPVSRGAVTELPRLFRARYAYKPRQRDELELTVGDILVVVQECDDGWMIGSSYTTKQTGTFPGNFVEPI